MRRAAALASLVAAEEDDVKRGREKLYYSISEVAEAADVKPHVLRYWETQFRMLRPKKNRAGNRMYRPQDLNLVLTIRELLYQNGYTIAGARRKLIECKRNGELTQGVLGGGAERDENGSGTPVDTSETTEPEGQLTLADAARYRTLGELRHEIESLLAYLESS